MFVALLHIAVVLHDQLTQGTMVGAEMLPYVFLQLLC
jgi:hypothetical protein